MAVSEDTAKGLWAEFEAASRQVKSQLVMKSGGGGAENRYSDAYQALAKAGEVQQLREKYR